MAVLQMQRISICALKHDRKAILEKTAVHGHDRDASGRAGRSRIREDGYAECEIKLRETGADYRKRTGCIE